MTQVYVNYFAILVAAVANMFLGFVWYGPLFGKQWIALMGWSKEQIESGKEKMKTQMWKTYSIAFLGSLVMGYVLARSLVFFSIYLGIYGISAGVQVGFYSWLGFIAPVTLGTVLWEGKPWKLWFLVNGYYLVSLLIMGTILSI